MKLLFAVVVCLLSIAAQASGQSYELQPGATYYLPVVVKSPATSAPTNADATPVAVVKRNGALDNGTTCTIVSASTINGAGCYTASGVISSTASRSDMLDITVTCAISSSGVGGCIWGGTLTGSKGTMGLSASTLTLTVLTGTNNDKTGYTATSATTTSYTGPTLTVLTGTNNDKTGYTASSATTTSYTGPTLNVNATNAVTTNSLSSTVQQQIAAQLTGSRFFYADQAQPNDTGDGMSWASAKQTVSAGVSLLSLPGDTLLVNAGSYDISNVTLIMPPNTSLIGQGRYRTQLFNSGSASKVIQVDAGVKLSGLSIVSTCTTHTTGPIYPVLTTTGIVTLDDLYVWGETDAIVTLVSTTAVRTFGIEARHCTFESNWDTCNITLPNSAGNPGVCSLDFTNCDFILHGPSAYGSNEPARAIVITSNYGWNTNITMRGGRLCVSNSGTGSSIGVSSNVVAGNAAKVTLQNVFFDVTNAGGGTRQDLNLGSSVSCVVSGCNYNPAYAVGTITVEPAVDVDYTKTGTNLAANITVPVASQTSVNAIPTTPLLSNDARLPTNGTIPKLSDFGGTLSLVDSTSLFVSTPSGIALSTTAFANMPSATVTISPSDLASVWQADLSGTGVTSGTGGNTAGGKLALATSAAQSSAATATSNSAQLTTIAAQTALITAGPITISSPLSTGDELSLTIGDDYRLRDGRAITATFSGGPVWTGATCTLTILRAADRQTVLTVSGTATSAYVLIFEPTKTQTTTLTPVPCTYRISGTLANGDVVTPLVGRCIVHQ